MRFTLTEFNEACNCGVGLEEYCRLSRKLKRLSIERDDLEDKIKVLGNDARVSDAKAKLNKVLQEIGRISQLLCGKKGGKTV